MANRYKEIEYPRSKVKKMGRLFSNNTGTQLEREEALRVINNWRAAHAFPLQVFYVNLNRRAQKHYDGAIVAQRLKRLDSITQKLNRFPTMSLSTMQDIGGCRIILETIAQVYDFVSIIKKSQWKHKFKEEYDYIMHPKSDGYRCYHLVYAYRSNKNTKYNGLFIEIQVRTRVQHMWATAVETMDEISKDKLKIGRGSTTNKEFFILASELLQLYEDNDYDLNATKQSTIALKLKQFDDKHHVLARLAAVKSTEGIQEQMIGASEGYFLLLSNVSLQQTRIYYWKEVESATNMYDTLEEHKKSDEDIVLVATSSLEALKKAYPNYFSDIGGFLQLMSSLIS